MRNIKRVLFTILLCILFITPIKANDFTEYERTESNNYGIKKEKIEITSKNKDDILATPYVDPSIKVYDFQNSLSDQEVEELQMKIEEFIDETGLDLVIVITSFPFSCSGDNCGTTNLDYAANFYDYNDFGLDLDDEYYSGIIIMRNEYLVDGLGYMEVVTSGEASLYYENHHNEIYSTGAPYMTSKNYYIGFNNMIDKLEYYYKKGKDDNLALDYYGNVYDTRTQKLDKNGNIVKKWQPPYLVAFIIALISELIVVGSMKKKNKMIHKAFTAGSFLDRNSINYTKRDNILTNTIVTHHKIDTSSGGGHGGGGSFHGGGSSGMGHSSGGGRC